MVKLPFGVGGFERTQELTMCFYLFKFDCILNMGRAQSWSNCRSLQLALTLLGFPLLYGWLLFLKWNLMLLSQDSHVQSSWQIHRPQLLMVCLLEQVNHWSNSTWWCNHELLYFSALMQTEPSHFLIEVVIWNLIKMEVSLC